MNRLRPLERWDHGFESNSRYGCLCGFILYVGSGLKLAQAEIILTCKPEVPGSNLMASLHMKNPLKLVLIAMTVCAVATVTGDELLAAEQQMALCVERIAQQYFTCGRSLLVSMPRDIRGNRGRPLLNFPYKNNLHLVNLVLHNLNENTCCPVQLFSANTKLDAAYEINYSYIIFVWPQEQDDDLIDSLRSQLDMLRDSEVQQWNPRGRFVVVVTDHDSDSPPSIPLQIYETMWTEYTVIDNVIVISNLSNKNVLDLYSGFPYEIGNCKQIREVSLMDQWIFEDTGKFYNRQNLFPQKLQKDFQNCVIRVASIGISPFVILTENHTITDGGELYDVRGFSVEYILIAINKMNLSAVFLPPSLELSLDAAVAGLSNLMSRQSDILIGMVPLLPVVLTAFTEPSIPYIYDAVKWFLPCPKPNARVHKIVTMYNTSVWLTMMLVLIVTGAVFWCSTKRPHRLDTKESKTLRTISNSICISWAIFIGISVPEMPKTWKIRIFFLVYVWYCFAMSTVFQAFFVSYLVEPGHEKKIETIEELIDSNVMYGYNTAMEVGMMTTDYTYHLKFPESRRTDCSNTKNCIHRMMSDGDVATIIDPMYVEYVTNEFGLEDQTKYLCTLKENVIDGTVIALLPKGSPLLNRFNKYIRRIMEGGLVERYWAELNLEARLRSKMKFDVDGSNMYFVFSLSHITPAFSVLGFGYMCGFILCLAECFHKRITKKSYHSSRGGSEPRPKEVAMMYKYGRGVVYRQHLARSPTKQAIIVFTVMAGRRLLRYDKGRAIAQASKRIAVMNLRTETIKTKGRKPLLEAFHLLASADITEFQTMDANSNRNKLAG
ncbi:hypothetical protein B7P43_G17653 [Cryptotermes secundus]|uniref:Ionotropic glutamate receptor C-terminal domain-containing protein n=1 Tax=Cryptotermes secundus TaxID=105785 RepID=A0A2J7PWL3_9NEOP|nr:hypothetical protein B7P43_G17653 [Cryptotermes secundus]